MEEYNLKESSHQEKPIQWNMKFHGFLSKYWKGRIWLQKLEFSIIWTLIISTIFTRCYQGNLAKFSFMPIFYYVKLSFFTRFFAYAIDFDKAKVKFGSVPFWLLSHHFGVIICHYVSFSLDLKHYTFLFALFGLIGFQGTQNTWLRKNFMLVYKIDKWIGVIAYSIFNVITMNMQEISLMIRLAFILAQIFMCLGNVLSWQYLNI